MGKSDTDPFSFLCGFVLFLSVLAILLLLGTYFLFLRKPRKGKVKFNPQRAKVYEIRLPKGTTWDPNRAINFLEHILGLFNAQVVLRIVAEPGQVVWQMIDCFTIWEDPSLVIQAIQSIYPEAEVAVSEYPPPVVTDPLGRFVLLFRLAKPFFAPIKSVMDVKENDPLASLVYSLAILQEGERVIYTLYISGPVDRYSLKHAVKRIQISDERKIAHFGLGLLDATLSKGHTSWQPLRGTGPTGKGRYWGLPQKLHRSDLCLL